MSWTIAEDEPGFIHVRAIIDAKNSQHELTELIDALVRRAGAPLKPKEIEDERPAT